MVELFVEGLKLDISQEISTVLSFSIDDIKDFAAKNSPVSKTIVLPGTKNNNKIFGNVFDISASNSYNPDLPNQGINFNAAITARAVLFNGNIQCMKGVLQILEITVDNDFIEYEVGIWGELTGFVAMMSSNKLEDLDFSTYNQTFAIGNIISSWSNTGGSGVYYPLIDYGNYSVDKHNWNIGTFRPALYVKEYIDKIFQAAGYTYDCDMFNGTSIEALRFKKLIIPHNQKKLVNRAYKALDIINTNATTYNTTGISAEDIAFNALATLGSFTASGSNKIFTYSGEPFIGSVKIYANTNDTNAFGPPLSLGVYVNSILIGSISLVRYSENNGTFNISINSGDVVETKVTYDAGTSKFVNVGISQVTITATDSTHLFDVSYGDVINMNDCIPQNINQVDFFSSILKLFQLYVYEDALKDKHLKITPFVDMFNSSVTQDWSRKLDRSKPYKLKTLSELNARYYEFKFKSDSDYYNDRYNKKYNIEYGSYRYDSDYQFSQEVITVDTIFSGTPLVGYAGEEKVYSTIFKRTGNTSPYVEESVDSNIRILQTKNITTPAVSSWNILAADGTTVLGSYTTYPYAGHFDDPDAPSNDLNYGLPNELYFVLLAGNISVNQFNVYWSTYMREITDKDAKMLIGKFNLSFKDIYNFSFGNYINIDGNLFRVNKISDFNITKPEPCEVELIKVNNLINF